MSTYDIVVTVCLSLLALVMFVAVARSIGDIFEFKDD